MRLPGDRLLTAALAAVVAGLVLVSGTHLPHLPEALYGAHAMGMAAPASAVPIALRVEQPADRGHDELWCAVVGVLPTVALAIALVLAATTVRVPLARAPRGRGGGGAPGDARPPPLTGSRRRATLQVFRN